MHTEELVTGQWVSTPLGRMHVLNNNAVYKVKGVAYWRTVFGGVSTDTLLIEVHIISASHYQWSM